MGVGEDPMEEEMDCMWCTKKDLALMLLTRVPRGEWADLRSCPNSLKLSKSKELYS